MAYRNHTTSLLFITGEIPGEAHHVVLEVELEGFHHLLIDAEALEVKHLKLLGWLLGWLHGLRRRCIRLHSLSLRLNRLRSECIGRRVGSYLLGLLRGNRSLSSGLLLVKRPDLRHLRQRAMHPKKCLCATQIVI